ncbi:MAG: large-conductance mechanosensitive channel protein MscL [Candidatus Liptonbacteria bacterium]|nr:large-conductance mechanosensitive channel protein MscL [Candidatus Liptonbacteria bacterium]
MLQEFKEFAMKGNVIDMAVGVIIGGAFGKIVTSLVNDVIMPPIGLILGGIDFTDKAIVLKRAAEDAKAVTLNYGLFINAVIDFLIVAFCIFMAIKQINRLKKPAPAAAPTTKECPMCISQVPLQAKKCPMCTSSLA